MIKRISNSIIYYNSFEDIVRSEIDSNAIIKKYIIIPDVWDATQKFLLYKVKRQNLQIL